MCRFMSHSAPFFFTVLLQHFLLFVSVAVDERTTLDLAYNELGYNNHSAVARRFTFVFPLLVLIGTQRNTNFRWYTCH